MGPDRTGQCAAHRRAACARPAQAGRYVPQVVRREVDPVGWFFYRENFHDMVQELFSAIDRSTKARFWETLPSGDRSMGWAFQNTLPKL